MAITQQHIDYALSKDIWDFGNQVLYDLCSKYPDHKDPKVVLGKIWLIGRSYAAAIERRRNVKETTNDFYKNKVVPVLLAPEIDDRLENLRKFKRIEDQSLEAILETHKYLMDAFHSITDQNNRSLASKYLHFHLPDLFYLYDSWAYRGLKVLRPGHYAKRNIKGKFDEEYAKFVLELLGIQDEITSVYGHKLTPRQLDQMLLKIAEETTIPQAIRA